MIRDNDATNREPVVSLRPLTPSDAKAIASWAADLDFCRAADWSQTKSLREHEQFHRQLISRPPVALIRLGAMSDGRLVGYVDLHGDDAVRRELGFLIGQRSDWNRGYGRAAAFAGMQYGFEQLDLHEIWAEALDANQGSVRILQRIHMREVEVGEPGQYLGVATHYRRFAIGRAAWEHLHAAPAE